MTKKKTLFICQECGYNSAKWMGKCPSCNSWNTFVEETTTPEEIKAFSGNSLSKPNTPQLIDEISLAELPHYSSGSLELDRVLGGGIISGSLVLMVGDPGVGKSSLNLRICATVAKEKNVLYVTGEESPQQIRMRAERLSALAPNLKILSEINIDYIAKAALEEKPQLIVIDSIQTIFSPLLQSAPGSVSQVRECAIALMKLAKMNNIAIFIIGHVTKDGTLAGPRVLEHIVDTVLYFEGERNAQFRLLRAVKNRFGNTNEIGIFEMRDCGLVDVPDTSKMFLSDETGHSGVSIVPTIEGTRPLLVEIQSLVANTPYIPPRRTSDLVDMKRLQLLLAVLEKRVKLSLGACDVYVKIAGGIKIEEPACDLALCLSLASSFLNKVIAPQTIVFGEVSLSGEVRAVHGTDIRLNEAAKLGFKRAIIPHKNAEKIPSSPLQIYGVRTVTEAINIAFKK